MAFHMPYGISLKVKLPGSLTQTVEQRINHELKTMRRQTNDLEAQDDLAFQMEKEITILSFNSIGTHLNVDYYPPLEATVKIFRLHIQKDCIGVSVDILSLRLQIPEVDMAPCDWPPSFGTDPDLMGCLWAILPRSLIAPDGILPTPYHI